MRLVAVGNYYGAHKPYMDMFKEFALLHIGSDVDSFLKEGDVVLFGGGEDISPTIYNQQPSRYSGADVQLSLRDKFESAVYKRALELGLPMIGICRGAQLICALSGGSLYQHVSNHSTGHNMTTNEDEEISISSVHHQMMNPEKTKHELLAWSSEVRSNVHLIENEINLDVDVEPEVIWFNDVKALAIQYHPEFMDFNSRGVTYARELVDKLILKGSDMYIDDVFNVGKLKSPNMERVYILEHVCRSLKSTLDDMNLRFIYVAPKDLLELEVFSDSTGRNNRILCISSVGACCGSLVLHSFNTSTSYNLAEYGTKPCHIQVDAKKVLHTVMDVLLSCGYTNVVYYCAEWQTDIKKLLVDYGFKPIDRFYNNRSGNYVEILNFDFPPIEREEDEEDDNY